MQIKGSLGVLKVVGLAAVAFVGGACSSSSGGGVQPDAGLGDAAAGALSGLTVSAIALFQGPKALLVKEGAAVAMPNAPVIAGRPGMLRVYVTPTAGWTARSVTAELHVLATGMEHSIPTQKLYVSDKSDDATPGTTFDFALSAADLPSGATLSVTLRDAAGASLRFPSDGSMLDLHALDGMKVKLKVVPLKYEADGSGRVSDTSGPAMQTLHDAIFGTYPAASVEITVRAQPLPFAKVLPADGTGAWPDALAAVGDTRAADGVPDDTYLVGLVDPAATLADFCPSNCIGTINALPGIGPSSRLLLMTGFPEQLKYGISSYLGIAMGRVRAPGCDVPNTDPNFPYADSLSPDPGYDIVGAQLVPANYRDILSCGKLRWVTDYTFAGLAKRIAFVNAH